MKNRKRTRIGTTLLAFIALLSTTVSGCGGNGNDVFPVKENDVEVWSTAGTEKILQDKTDGYDAVKGDAKIDAYAVKGEKEGTHLILTAQRDVDNVNLQLSDLTLVGENDTKFSSQNIAVFFEKYLELTRNYEKNGAETGNYPDALVPMDKIAERGENVVKSGNNQGLYVRFDVPENQKAGIYEGTFTLTYGGIVKKIPVTLEVYDLAIGKETHLRTLFIDEWQYRLGELDSTQAMLEKYIEAGLEYRVSPAGVTIEDGFDEESLDFYVETAAKFMVDERCTHISLPLKSKSVGGYSAIDGAMLEKVLYKFVDKSVEDNFNYVKKLGCHLVDEPQLHNGLERTRTVTKIYYDALNEVADGVLLMDVETAFKEELSESVRNIRGIITASYEEEYAYDEELGAGIKTWCPTVDFYHFESARELYDAEEAAYYGEDGEKWWYTCISPRAPYPTYHIEDTLLSARLLSWMQAEYDVTGNLYWATNVYANYTGAGYENIEDFYSGNASRYVQVNGDGFLFYPGKVYGVDGPLGSLRLEAIRDGIEEYEIMYALKERYALLRDEIGVDFDEKSVLNSITNALYSGTQVATNGASFDRARRTLLNLAFLSASDANFTVTDFENDNSGTVALSVYVENGYELYLGGEKLNGEAKGNGSVYRFSVGLENDENTLELQIKSTTGGKTYVYEENLGGKVLVYSAEDLKGVFVSGSATVSAETVDFASVASGREGTLLKLTVSETVGETQKFRLVGELVKNVNGKTKNVCMRLYNAGETEETIVISAKTKGDKSAKELYNGVLATGDNEIELVFNMFDLDASEIEYIAFTVGKDKDYNAGKTFYVENIVLAGK